MGNKLYSLVEAGFPVAAPGLQTPELEEEPVKHRFCIPVKSISKRGLFGRFGREDALRCAKTGVREGVTRRSRATEGGGLSKVMRYIAC